MRREFEAVLTALTEQVRRQREPVAYVKGHDNTYHVELKGLVAVVAFLYENSPRPSKLLFDVQFLEGFDFDRFIRTGEGEPELQSGVLLGLFSDGGDGWTYWWEGSLVTGHPAVQALHTTLAGVNLTPPPEVAGLVRASGDIWG